MSKLGPEGAEKHNEIKWTVDMDLCFESTVLACCHKGRWNTFDYFSMHMFVPVFIRISQLWLQ